MSFAFFGLPFFVMPSATRNHRWCFFFFFFFLLLCRRLRRRHSNIVFVLCVVVVVVVVFGGTIRVLVLLLFFPPPPPLFLSRNRKTPPKPLQNLVFHYLYRPLLPSSSFSFKKFRNNAFHFHRVEQYYLYILPTQKHAHKTLKITHNAVVVVVVVVMMMTMFESENRPARASRIVDGIEGMTTRTAEDDANGFVKFQESFPSFCNSKGG